MYVTGVDIGQLNRELRSMHANADDNEPAISLFSRMVESVRSALQAGASCPKLKECKECKEKSTSDSRSSTLSPDERKAFGSINNCDKLGKMTAFEYLERH